MAMDGNELGDAIYAAIISPAAPPDVQGQVKALWEKIGTAIVTYIQDKAEVPAGISVSTNTGSGSTTAAGSVQ
jgi:hypothetical protein